MKQNFAVPQKLSGLADAVAMALPKGINANTLINAVESEHAKAGPGTLTFLEEKSPAAVYTSSAGAILVPQALGRLIPRDESVQVIPVDSPKEVFDRISALAN